VRGPTIQFYSALADGAWSNGMALPTISPPSPVRPVRHETGSVLRAARQPRTCSRTDEMPGNPTPELAAKSKPNTVAAPR
jgi:hypothetical protein